MNIQKKDFRQFFLEKKLLIDVRAPIEFQLGAVPGAINLPLLDDEERHLVGTTYKQKGQAAAIELGHQLVSGSIKENRIHGWQSAVRQNKNSVIYCFRGGLRSKTVQLWLSSTGFDVPLVEGGYKALRNFFIDLIASLPEKIDWVIVQGPTGSKKTSFIKKQNSSYIDLEALACHRGSAFGAYEVPQPTQINFENLLALELLKVTQQKGPVFIESESRMIGRLNIPEPLFKQIKYNLKKIKVELPLEDRVENILQEYVKESKLGVRGDLSQFDEFRKSVRAISRKLGGERTQEILSDIDNAQQDYILNKNFENNRLWIRKLLVWYYDPYYLYGQNQALQGSNSK